MLNCKRGEESISDLKKTNRWDPYKELSTNQHELLNQFEHMLLSYNRKINLVSQDTEADFKERHLLHSLAIAWKDFLPGSNVVDWGTGGGLPVVPLAICFPDVRFYAVDAVGKKLQVVQTIARRLGLENLITWHGRAESWTGQANYAVSRATAPLADLWKWFSRVRRSNNTAQSSATTWGTGLIALKGGDLTSEIETLKQAAPNTTVSLVDLESLLGSSYFQQKHLVHVSDRLPLIAGTGTSA